MISFKDYNFYFETSAVNFLADNYTINDAIATKALQSTKGNRWFISPVTMWEILLTKDEMRREHLIAICQQLFFEKMLMSPSEIVTDFIEKNCPHSQYFNEFYTKSQMGTTWSNICGDIAQTFNYDFEELKRITKHVNDISKKVDDLINKIVLSIYPDDNDQLFVLIEILSNSFNIPKDTPEMKKQRKLTILFAFYHLCIGTDLSSESLNNFWGKRKIKDRVERLHYLFKNYPSLLLYGPFVEFANMALHQIKPSSNTNRGLFHDSLHCIYLPFIDIFMTNDNHFISYRDLKIMPHHKKIVSISNDIIFKTKVVKIN